MFKFTMCLKMKQMINQFANALDFIRFTSLILAKAQGALTTKMLLFQDIMLKITFLG